MHHKQRPVSWVAGHTLWASCHDKTDRCGGRPIRLGKLPDAKRLADERDAAVFSFNDDEGTGTADEDESEKEAEQDQQPPQPAPPVGSAADLLQRKLDQLDAQRKQLMAEKRRRDRQSKRQAGKASQASLPPDMMTDFAVRFVEAVDARTEREFPWLALHGWAMRHKSDESCAPLVDMLLLVLDSYWKLVEPSKGCNMVLTKRPETRDGLLKGEPCIETQDWVWRPQDKFVKEVVGHMTLGGISLGAAWLAQPTLTRWRGADWQPPYSQQRLAHGWQAVESMEDSEDSEDSSVQQHSKRHSATTNNIESIHTYRRPWCSSSFISSTTSTTSTTLAGPVARAGVPTRAR